jgi:dTDP-glucose 4,6-dehydratase
MVEGIFRLINSNYHYPLNIGNPDEMTILELAEKIKKFTNSKSNIVYHDLPVDDPLVRRPDITKAKKILNWEPKINFDEGIQKTIEWFK